MKLECKIGSLSCDGVLAEKGDIFELPDNVAAGIINLGYAIESQDITPADLPDGRADNLNATKALEPNTDENIYGSEPSVGSKRKKR